MNDPAEEVSTYYVRRRGKVEGPWKVEKLQAEVKLRKLSRFHEISMDLRIWDRAESLALLFPQRPVDSTITSNQLLEETVPQQKSSGWFVGIDGREVGPKTTKEIVDLIAKRLVEPSDLVWQDGYPDWIAIECVPEFASLVFHPRGTNAAVGEHIQLSTADLIDASTDGKIKTASSLATPSFIMGLITFPFLPLLSFVFGLMIPIASAFFLLCIPIGLIAGVFGIIAYRQISKNSYLESSKQKTVIGIITGFGGSIGTILFLAAVLIVAYFNLP